MSKLKAKINTLFMVYKNLREEKYKKQTCIYYKEKSAASRSGSIRKAEIIVIESKYDFLPSTLQHTTNGDNESTSGNYW